MRVEDVLSAVTVPIEKIVYILGLPNFCPKCLTGSLRNCEKSKCSRVFSGLKMNSQAVLQAYNAFTLELVMRQKSDQPLSEENSMINGSASHEMPRSLHAARQWIG